VKYTFTPNGDGELIKHRTKHILYANWLRKRNYTVKKNDLFLIKGEIQVAPLPTELVSSNLMNTTFIKN